MDKELSSTKLAGLTNTEEGYRETWLDRFEEHWVQPDGETLKNISLGPDYIPAEWDLRVSFCAPWIVLQCEIRVVKQEEASYIFLSPEVCMASVWEL